MTCDGAKANFKVPVWGSLLTGSYEPWWMYRLAIQFAGLLVTYKTEETMIRTPRIFSKALFLLAAFTFYVIGLAHISMAEKADHRLQRAMDKSQPSPQKEARRAVRLDLLHIIGKRAPEMDEADRWKLTGAVVKYAAAHGHDPYLLLAVIETESAYRHDAVSNVGAVGYMQLRPFVARAMASEVKMDSDFAPHHLTDMDTNVRLGSYYLSKMKARFGDLTLALVAYNLGPSKLREVLRKGKKPSLKYTIKVFNSKRRILNASPMASAGKNSV